MITTAQEYFANLDLIQNVNQPAYAILPSAENIYNIDINTRTIEAPQFLSLEKDHKSETIYFQIDRFVDYMDLAQTCCIIQYNNANHKSRFYPVPFYDVYTKADKNKILFPWCLDASVAEIAGLVQFSIRFFKIGERLNDRNEMEKFLAYNMNTLPAESKILKGITEYKPDMDSNYLLTPSQFDQLTDRIDNLARFNKVFWTMLDDSFIDPIDTEDIEQDLEEIMDNYKDPEELENSFE